MRPVLSMVVCLAVAVAAWAQEDPDPHGRQRQWLKAAIVSREDKKIYDAAFSLAQGNTAAAIDILVKLGLQSNSVRVEDAVGKALSRVPEGAGLDRVCHLCTKHTDARVRDQILEWAAKVNRHKRVQVNTIGFERTKGEVGNFLHILAYQNRGEYIEIP